MTIMGRQWYEPEHKQGTVCILNNSMQVRIKRSQYDRHNGICTPWREEIQGYNVTYICVNSFRLSFCWWEHGQIIFPNVAQVIVPSHFFKHVMHLSLDFSDFSKYEKHDLLFIAISTVVESILLYYLTLERISPTYYHYFYYIYL